MGQQEVLVASDLPVEGKGSAFWERHLYPLVTLSSLLRRYHLFCWVGGVAFAFCLTCRWQRLGGTTMNTPPSFLALWTLSTIYTEPISLSSHLYHHFFRKLIAFFLPPRQKHVLSTMEAAIAPVRILRQVFIAVVPLDSLSSWMGRPVKVACASPCC